MNRRREFKNALKTVAPYILSHHEPHEYYRCIRIKQTWICARCLGVYLGIFSTIIALLATSLSTKPWLVALLPAPALIDWSVSHFHISHSTNTIHIITGGLLGAGYVFGVMLLLSQPTLALAIGSCYALIALVLYKITTGPTRHARPKNT